VGEGVRGEGGLSGRRVVTSRGSLHAKQMRKKKKEKKKKKINFNHNQKENFQCSKLVKHAVLEN
jgi:hypothetical protein